MIRFEHDEQILMTEHVGNILAMGYHHKSNDNYNKLVKNSKLLKVYCNLDSRALFLLNRRDR